MEQEIQSNPWSQRQELGLFPALWQTVTYVLFRPADFFESLKIEGSFTEPFLFYFILDTCIAWASFILALIFKRNPSLTPSAVLLAFMLIPFFIASVIFIGSAILHLFVILCKGKGGFIGTFNVLAYNSATSIFNIIPFVGGFISGIWAVVIGVIAFKRVHGLSTPRAVLAYLGFPVLIGVIAMMAAVALPNLLKAKISANEDAAKAKVIALSTAIESYKAAKGSYPKDELDLKYAEPPFVKESLDGRTMQGYTYSLTFIGEGYEIVAQPQECQLSGNSIFTALPGKNISERKCLK